MISKLRNYSRDYKWIAFFLCFIILIGAFPRIGYSWEGTGNTGSLGYLEVANINATDEFYRGGENYTEWILTQIGGGTVDHGTTTGLGDDDHPLYLLDDGSEVIPSLNASIYFEASDYYIDGYNLTQILMDYADANDDVGTSPVGRFVSGYDYLIYKNSSTYYAVDWQGDQQYTNSDAEDIIEDVWGALSGGGSFCTVGIGTWTIDETISSQNDDVDWYSDWGLMFEAQNSFAVDTPVVHVTHDHCTLRSVYVNGNADNQAEYPTDDWEVSFNEQIGIFVQGDYVSLLRPRVEEVVTHGIKYSSCTGGLVENGYTFNTSWNGIHFTSGSTGCKAIGNEVTAYSDVGIGNYGDYNTISNNYVHDAYEITGSTNTQWGIGIEGGTHCLVSNNQLEDLALGIVEPTV